MNTTAYDLIDPIFAEYIGDDLMWEDLQRGFSAFMEDQRSEVEEQTHMETA